MVPAKSMTRSEVSPAPLYANAAPVEPLPILMVPLETVAGAPSEHGLPTLQRFETVSVPALIAVEPV